MGSCVSDHFWRYVDSMHRYCLKCGEWQRRLYGDYGTDYSEKTLFYGSVEGEVWEKCTPEDIVPDVAVHINLLRNDSKYARNVYMARKLARRERLKAEEEKKRTHSSMVFVQDAAHMPQ